MTWITTNYQIATGHNNAAGLTLVTAITGSGLTAFVDVQGVGQATLGEKVVTVGGRTKRNGFSSTNWISGYLTVAQLAYLRTTYGEQSASGGLVTIKTTLDNVTFSNYNAVLDLPDPATLEYGIYNDATLGYNGGAFLNVVWAFTQMGAI